MAKGGPKLKQSSIGDVDVPGDDRPPRFVPDQDGFPALPSGDTPASMVLTRDGVTSMSVRGRTLVGLTRVLKNGLGAGARLVDKTGLTGL